MSIQSFSFKWTFSHTIFRTIVVPHFCLLVTPVTSRKRRLRAASFLWRGNPSYKMHCYQKGQFALSEEERFFSCKVSFLVRTLFHHFSFLSSALLYHSCIKQIILLFFSRLCTPPPSFRDGHRPTKNTLWYMHYYVHCIFYIKPWLHWPLLTTNLLTSPLVRVKFSFFFYSARLLVPHIQIGSTNFFFEGQNKTKGIE